MELFEHEVEVESMKVDTHYQLLTITTKDGRSYMVELIPTE